MTPLPYIPENREHPYVVRANPSAWGDIPEIIADIIKTFNITPNLALEFGVEYGYSTSALAFYFNAVVGVDTFTGDVNSTIKSDHMEFTKNALFNCKNICLVKSDFRDFIIKNNTVFDLIHIDIAHNFKDTFDCAFWAIKHAKVIILHDTVSYPPVMNACLKLCEMDSSLLFYNYEHSCGLGIIYNPNFVAPDNASSTIPVVSKNQAPIKSKKELKMEMKAIKSKFNKLKYNKNRQ